MEELWAYVDNTAHEYEISTLGRLRRTIDGETMFVTPHKDRCGYYRVHIHGKTYAIHRLVALAFIPNPYNYPIVHHIDENKTNNEKNNLLWCSYQQNRIFTIPSTSGKNAKTKYRVLQLDMSGNIVAEWNSFIEAARSLGLEDSSLITKCAHHVKHRNSAYGYLWDVRCVVPHEEALVTELAKKAYSLNPEKTMTVLRMLAGEE